MERSKVFPMKEKLERDRMDECGERNELEDACARKGN